MSKHGSDHTFSTKRLVISLVAVLCVFVLAVGMLIIQNARKDVPVGPTDSVISSQTTPSSSDSSDDPSSGSAPTSSDVTVIEPVFAYPETMRGVFLTAGTEYLTSDKDTAEAVCAQIDKALQKVAEWNFNTILLPLKKDGKALYASEFYETVPLAENTDILAYILEKARECGLYVYAVWDMGVYSGECDPTVPQDAEKTVNAVKEIAPRYGFDGFLIDNVGYAYKMTGNKEMYEQHGGDLTFEQFMCEKVHEMTVNVLQAIREANLHYYTGLLASGVWAHKSVDERGSQTRGVYEEMTDGRADTRHWLEQGLLDFVMVKNYTTTISNKFNFNVVLDWWDKLCQENGVPLYIAHASDKVGTKGWTSPDQLSRQVLACRESEACKGSAFSSLQAMLDDETGSTDAVHKAFSGTLLEEYISSELKVSTPEKKEITTMEDHITLRGSADPNFPIKVNGKEIELSKHGFFSETVELKPGVNTFVFEHKGKTLTYQVIYKVVVVHSMVTPLEDLAADGGTVVIIQAIARKDAEVYATLNGIRIPMVASPLQEEDSSENLSAFENYSGSYELPAGLLGRVRELGAVTVYGSFSGLTDTVKGGKISVNAIPVDPDDDVTIPGIVEGLTTISPDAGSGEKLMTGSLVLITADYAETFDGKTTDDKSRPVNSYLPKGTTDQYVKTVQGKYKFYLLASGKRVLASAATLYNTDTVFNANALYSGVPQVSEEYTMLTFAADWRIPFNVQLLPQKYANPTASKPSYNIINYGFTAEYVDIVFQYTYKVEGTPDMTNSPLFTKAEWIKGKDNTYTLRLYLTKKGGFYGYSMVWDDDGVLHLSFKHPKGTAEMDDEQALAGVTIVLDPGHGGSEKAFELFGNSEKELNVTYSNLIKQKLEELGAIVTLTRVEDVNPSHDERIAMARNNGTDLFLSIHMNAITSGAPGSVGTASGATVHYFNEYSAEIIKGIADYMRAVEKQYNIGNRAAVRHWSPFNVLRLHDTMSVLIECGFYDNPRDVECLINPVYQDKLTTAIVNGIVDYFQSLPRY